MRGGLVNSQECLSRERNINMPTKHAGAQKHFGDVAPKLAEISGDVLYNDVWERPGLSKRDRCMITVASIITGYRTHQLPFPIKKALDHAESGRASSRERGWQYV